MERVEEAKRGAKDYEALRRSFQPKRVTVLFVGEAPPASAAFFYEPRSSRHRVVQRVFEKAFDLNFAKDEFLRWFSRAGCYLEDLSHDPVDGLTANERRAAYDSGSKRLATALAKLRPAVVVSLLRRVCPYVQASVERAELQVELVEVPYPGRWPAHRAEFEGTLVKGLRRWKHAGTLVLPADGY